MNIAVYCKNFYDKDIDFFIQLFHELNEQKINVQAYEPFYHFVREKFSLPQEITVFNTHEDLLKETDCLFSIGGDGTILGTTSLVKSSGIPVLGINIGRLGFLSGIAKEQIKLAIENILQKKYTLESRTLIRIESEQDLFGEFNYALNEYSFHKKDSPSMIRIQAYLDDEYLNSYWADGLIVATPTGSTGYSLSCGGPIITPDVECFIITPIATHNLTVRPLIISDKAVIKLKFEETNKHIMIGQDFRYTTVTAPLEVILKKENFKINLVRMENQNFFNTIRNKLMWGHDIRNNKK